MLGPLILVTCTAGWAFMACSHGTPLLFDGLRASSHSMQTYASKALTCKQPCKAVNIPA